MSLLGRFGWFAENSGKNVHIPRGLRPGIRGLFDLHGNLFEWNHNWYEHYYSALVAPDPEVSKGGSLRAIRGGSWVYGAANCRTAGRNPKVPTFRSHNLGFRLALSPSGVFPRQGK